MYSMYSDLFAKCRTGKTCFKDRTPDEFRQRSLAREH